MKKYIAAMCLASLAGGAWAADAKPNNVGCGVGSMIFEGSSDVISQILASTTNGSFGNQTFGISSGTVGCSQNGMVPARKMAVLFIEGNQDKLAAEMASGQGASLTGLAYVVGVSPAEQMAFNQTLKQHYAAIVTDSQISAAQMQANLKSVLAASAFKAQAEIL